VEEVPAKSTEENGTCCREMSANAEGKSRMLVLAMYVRKAVGIAISEGTLTCEGIGRARV
jgi:hypothetical protein